jgi:hypothetical protein
MMPPGLTPKTGRLPPWFVVVAAKVKYPDRDEVTGRVVV